MIQAPWRIAPWIEIIFGSRIDSLRGIAASSDGHTRQATRRRRAGDQRHHQVLKSGGRWIDAPAAYGPRKTLYNHYVRWAAKGVWVALFQALFVRADHKPIFWSIVRP